MEIVTMYFAFSLPAEKGILLVFWSCKLYQCISKEGAGVEAFINEAAPMQTSLLINWQFFYCK